MEYEVNPFFQDLNNEKKHPLLGLLQTIVVATSSFIVLYLFVITPNQVDGPSMLPNFKDGQVLFTNKLSQWLGHTSLGKSLGLNYERGDVVIFQAPTEQKAIIKRVIALPGERIALREGFFYIDNQLLEENYLPPSTYTNGGPFLEDGGESVLVEEGTFFVVGDNRPVSRDSRAIGLIARTWIKGKAFFRIFPLEDIGFITRGTYNLVTSSALVF
jgi:signal peptidase I